MLKVCLLASGGLGFTVLSHLFDSSNKVVAVLTDKSSLNIIDFCNKKNIPIFSGNPRKGKTCSFISHVEFEILLSVNYLFIIEEDLISAPKKYAINIHGSLLPKYRGRTPHVWAIINGETETGATAHLIDNEVDIGDVLHQVKFPIGRDDTGAIILEKFNRIYPELVDKVFLDISSNNLVKIPQDHAKATFFGKRTPEDGLINWNWSKERIRNWVRAQAKPYPGAYTYFNDGKIKIHKAEYSDQGFHYEMENGTILNHSETSITVKTPNGAILISNLEYDNFFKPENGQILR